MPQRSKEERRDKRGKEKREATSVKTRQRREHRSSEGQRSRLVAGREKRQSESRPGGEEKRDVGSHPPPPRRDGGVRIVSETGGGRFILVARGKEER